MTQEMPRTLFFPTRWRAEGILDNEDVAMIQHITTQATRERAFKRQVEVVKTLLIELLKKHPTTPNLELARYLYWCIPVLPLKSLIPLLPLEKRQKPSSTDVHQLVATPNTILAYSAPYLWCSAKAFCPGCKEYREFYFSRQFCKGSRNATGRIRKSDVCGECGIEEFNRERLNAKRERLRYNKEQAAQLERERYPHKFGLLPTPQKSGTQRLVPETFEEGKYASFKEWYHESYLKSAWWQIARAIVLDRAGNRCQMCNDPTNQLYLHHRNYEHWGTPAELKDLIVLCKECHELFHTNLKLHKS